MIDFYSEKRRRDTGRGSVAFFLSFLLLGWPSLFAASLAACSDRERPIFGPQQVLSDTVEPTITFEAPSQGATITRGDAVGFLVRVSSVIELAAVKAIVTGAVNFEFPVVAPADTAWAAELLVSTEGSEGNKVEVQVTATDVLGHQATGTRSIFLQDAM